MLDEVWKPALAKAKEELADINAEIKKEGGNFEAEGWDWRYYFEKAKKAKFNLDENEVRPYLKLDNVREGAFYVANKLYGITFTPIRNIPLPLSGRPGFLSAKIRMALIWALFISISSLVPASVVAHGVVLIVRRLIRMVSVWLRS